ncbi:hypothetical protein BST61_g1326 [Cercospora zeina]
MDRIAADGVRRRSDSALWGVCILIILILILITLHPSPSRLDLPLQHVHAREAPAGGVGGACDRLLQHAPCGSLPMLMRRFFRRLADGDDQGSSDRRHLMILTTAAAAAAAATVRGVGGAARRGADSQRRRVRSRLSGAVPRDPQSQFIWELNLNSDGWCCCPAPRELGAPADSQSLAWPLPTPFWKCLLDTALQAARPFCLRAGMRAQKHCSPQPRRRGGGSGGLSTCTISSHWPKLPAYNHLNDTHLLFSQPTITHTSKMAKPGKCEHMFKMIKSDTTLLHELIERLHQKPTFLRSYITSITHIIHPSHIRLSFYEDIVAALRCYPSAESWKGMGQIRSDQVRSGRGVKETEPEWTGKGQVGPAQKRSRAERVSTAGIKLTESHIDDLPGLRDALCVSHP